MTLMSILSGSGHEPASVKHWYTLQLSITKKHKLKRLRNTSRMEVTIRRAVAEDAGFLTQMLVHAAFWRPDGPAGSVDEVLSNPYLSHYVTGWPRFGDLGLIAQARHPVGAAWIRFFPASDPGYGFVDAAIPEASMGVEPGSRGRGIGGLLLAALIAASRGEGLPALSLSVESDNHAHRLYERFGFEQVATALGSHTMLLHL